MRAKESWRNETRAFFKNLWGIFTGWNMCDSAEVRLAFPIFRCRNDADPLNLASWQIHRSESSLFLSQIAIISVVARSRISQSHARTRQWLDASRDTRRGTLCSVSNLRCRFRRFPQSRARVHVRRKQILIEGQRLRRSLARVTLSAPERPAQAAIWWFSPNIPSCSSRWRWCFCRPVLVPSRQFFPKVLQSQWMRVQESFQRQYRCHESIEVTGGIRCLKGLERRNGSWTKNGMTENLPNASKSLSASGSLNKAL